MKNKPNGATHLFGKVVAQLYETFSIGNWLAQPFRDIIFVDCDCFLLL